MALVRRERIREWNGTWSLAVVFGLASVPWTYAFVAGDVPLWPAFVASATFFAVDRDGVAGLARGYASNVAGIALAAATLAVVAGLLGDGTLALAVAVGAAMFLASLGEFVPLLSFTPGMFFGYATLFGVHAADATAFGVVGLAGETLAAAVAMVIGAAIGLGADAASDALA